MIGNLTNFVHALVDFLLFAFQSLVVHVKVEIGNHAKYGHAYNLNSFLLVRHFMVCNRFGFYRKLFNVRLNDLHHSLRILLRFEQIDVGRLNFRAVRLDHLISWILAQFTEIENIGLHFFQNLRFFELLLNLFRAHGGVELDRRFSLHELDLLLEDVRRLERVDVEQHAEAVGQVEVAVRHVARAPVCADPEGRVDDALQS